MSNDRGRLRHDWTGESVVEFGIDFTNRSSEPAGTPAVRGLLYRDCLIAGVAGLAKKKVDVFLYGYVLCWVPMWQRMRLLIENWAGRPGFCSGDIRWEAFDYAFL